MQEFYRHIEIGSFREKIKHLIALGGNDRKRGSAYTKALFKELLRKRKRLLPYAFLQISAKFLGYQIGKMYTKYFSSKKF